MPANKDDQNARWLQALVAEYIGAMCLTMTVILTRGDPQFQFIGVGCTITTLIYTFCHVSGAHFNPAVTLSFVLRRAMSVGQGLVYWFIQLLGAFSGSLIAYSVAGEGDIAPFSPNPDLKNPQLSAFIVEVAFTFALVFVTHAIDLRMSEAPGPQFAFAVGCVLIAGASAVGGISGAVFNPAVGTAVDFAAWAGSTQPSYTWIYWVGPLLGSALGLGAFVLIRASLDAGRAAAAEVAALEADAAAAASASSSSSSSSSVVMSAAARARLAEAQAALPSRILMMEFIGTFFLTLTAALGSQPFAVGMILTSMVFAGGQFCGADYNPAVTLAALIRSGVVAREWWKGALVMVVQTAAAIIAAFLAYAASQHVGWPHPDGPESLWGAIGYEGMWTGLLVIVVLSAATQTEHPNAPGAGERAAAKAGYVGMAIGFTLTGGATSAGSHGSGSGGVFNPAVGTGLGIAAYACEGKSAMYIWIYWVGPMIGAVIGTGIFTLLNTHANAIPRPGPAAGEGFEIAVTSHGLGGTAIGSVPPPAMTKDDDVLDTPLLGRAGGDMYPTDESRRGIGGAIAAPYTVPAVAGGAVNAAAGARTTGRRG